MVQQTSIQLRYSKGETVFKQRGRASNLVFLHRGIVKFSYQYDSGSNYIMTIIKGPALLGGANLFFNESNIFSVTAMEESEICLIDIEKLKGLAVRHPKYIMALCESAIGMFQHSIFHFISLAHNQVNGRIANILLYLWDHVYKNSGFDFTVSRKEISEFAACSHENVITTLSKFKKEGLIHLEGKKIIIVDHERLINIGKKG
jgi:CRP/FNR family transcriptional regulator